MLALEGGEARQAEADRVEQMRVGAAGVVQARAQELERGSVLAQQRLAGTVGGERGELAAQLMEQQGGCGLDFDGGPGNCGAVQPRGNQAFMLTKSLPLLGQDPQ